MIGSNFSISPTVISKNRHAIDLEERKNFPRKQYVDDLIDCSIELINPPIPIESGFDVKPSLDYNLLRFRTGMI